MKKLWKVICAFLLGALGFTSCSTARHAVQEQVKEADPADQPVEEVVRPDPRVRLMYGMPPARYQTSSIVKDTDPENTK